MGEDHSDVGSSCYNMAALAFEQKDLPQALELFTRAATIYRTSLGKGHPHTDMALSAVKQVHAAMV
jgi:hypothetical protein